MIGKLKGIVDSIGEQHVLLDVGGVGYIAYCSALTLRGLPGAGEATSLIIETHVREDHIHLFGFAGEAEREWFRLLLTVKGVGPRVALGILSVLNPSQLATAIASQDKAAFKPVGGVGPKLAERLLTELKGKDTVGAGAGIAPITAGAVPGKGTVAAVQDAVSALTNLGYSRSDAYQTVTRLAGLDKNATVENLIRDGLRELAS